MTTFHFVWLKGRQVIPKAIVVPKDLHAFWYQFVPRAHVAVPLGEHLAVPVEVPEHLEEPVLIGALLIEKLHQGPNGNDIFLRPPILSYRVVNGDSDEVDEHLVGGWIRHRMDLYIFPFGHPNLPAADQVHELDADETLSDGGQDVPGELHGFVEVLLAPDDLADLLPGHVGVRLGLHTVICQRGLSIWK